MSTSHTCIVCLESIESNFAALTTCGHVFHTECLKIWMNQAKSCPICRIGTPSTKILKLFIDDVATCTAKVDAEKLLAENEIMSTLLEEEKVQNKALMSENDSLQQKLAAALATIKETEKASKTRGVIQRGRKTKQDAARQWSNTTIDLTCSPPPSPKPPAKRARRMGGATRGTA